MAYNDDILAMKAQRATALETSRIERETIALSMVDVLFDLLRPTLELSWVSDGLLREACWQATNALIDNTNPE